jgi:hypothetical protein
MRRPGFIKIAILLLVFSLGICGPVTAVSPVLNSAAALVQPRKAKKAQKKQDKKEKEKKKAIKDGSKETRKRSYEMQSPDVQARMKQNQKDTETRDKAKKKSTKARTKQGAKKYK